MTSRADMIEAAARALHANYRRHDGYATDIARVVLDAVLPQITTAEQLETLMARVAETATPAVVVDAAGRPWTLFEDDRGDWHAQRLGDQDEPQAVTVRIGEGDLVTGHQPLAGGPLTVVWQPK